MCWGSIPFCGWIISHCLDMRHAIHLLMDTSIVSTFSRSWIMLPWTFVDKYVLMPVVSSFVSVPRGGSALAWQFRVYLFEKWPNSFLQWLHHVTFPPPRYEGPVSLCSCWHSSLSVDFAVLVGAKRPPIWLGFAFPWWLTVRSLRVIYRSLEKCLLPVCQLGCLSFCYELL